MCSFPSCVHTNHPLTLGNSAFNSLAQCRVFLPAPTGSVLARTQSRSRSCRQGFGIGSLSGRRTGISCPQYRWGLEGGEGRREVSVPEERGGEGRGGEGGEGRREVSEKRKGNVK